MKQLIFCTLLLFLSGCAGKSANNNVKTSSLERIIHTTVEYCKVGEITGPIALSYRKLSIEEIAEHLDMDIETAKLHLKATNVHGYFSLSANNIPPEGEFTLYHTNLSGKITPTKTYFINGNHLLVTKLDDIYIDLADNFLFFSNYLPGEPANFVLVSSDQKYLSAIRIIPNPIERIDSQKHRVSLEISSPDYRKYTVHSSGLQAFGTYMLITRFENEKFVTTFEADSKGESFVPTGPNTPWRTGGDGSVELRGDGIHTPIHLEFQWGA